MGTIGMQEILVILLIIAALGLPALIAIVVVLWVTKKKTSLPTAPLPISSPGERQSRLEELKSLRDQDLISEQEYNDKRARIIDEV